MQGPDERDPHAWGDLASGLLGVAATLGAFAFGTFSVAVAQTGANGLIHLGGAIGVAGLVVAAIVEAASQHEDAPQADGLPARVPPRTLVRRAVEPHPESPSPPV